MALHDVVITGTSTGMGRAMARLLVARGVRVFGSVRRGDDAARLRSELGERFAPLTMDVKDGAAVARAAAVVREALAGRVLGGLVNNAGVARAGPLLEQSIDEFEEHLRINLTGVLRVTQAFAPLLGAAKGGRAPTPGRIVNISSVAGKFAAPFLGAYVASKHALEGMSEALRRELMLYGVDVVVIGPGSVVTPIWDKAERRADAYASSVYERAYRGFQRLAVAEGRNGLSPDRIAEAVWHALTVRAPRARYAVVPQPFRNWTLPRLLPTRLADRLIARRLGLTGA